MAHHGGVQSTKTSFLPSQTVFVPWHGHKACALSCLDRTIVKYLCAFCTGIPGPRLGVSRKWFVIGEFQCKWLEKH